MQNFEKKFNSECLGETGLKLQFTYRIGGGNGATAKNIITQFEYLKTNAELDKLIVSIIGSGVSEYTAIQRLNNWLITNTSYDYSGNDVAASTASAILYNRKAICSGYTDFVEHACNLYNISCQTIYSEPMNHVWNRIKIGSKWYYLDVTWNLNGNRYFLSEKLWSNHYF